MKLDQFAGVNAGYVFELYERYLQDPDSVDPATRKAFENWTPADPSSPSTPVTEKAPAGVNLHAVVGAANLAESIRRYGHLAARIDPVGAAPPGDPSLYPEAHGITEADLR